MLIWQSQWLKGGAMTRKYIYGIVDTYRTIILNTEETLTTHGVYLLRHNGLGAVVGDCPDIEISSLPKEDIIRCLLKHQRAVEQIMRQADVLPVKFGTILATDREVLQLLSQGRQLFSSELANMRDKVEYEVAARWDTQKVLSDISTEDDICRARNDLAGRGPVAVEDRIRLGKMVKAAMDRKRVSYRKSIIDLLDKLAVDRKINPLISDDLVTNIAFLINKRELNAFDNAVKQLNDYFNNQLDFHIIGPLPPYSFATVEVSTVDSAKIEQAMKLLGLKGVCSESDIKKAYRHVAAAIHPDSHTGGENAKARFITLRQASDLLIAWRRAQAVTRGDFLISINRPNHDREATEACFGDSQVLVGV